MSRDAFWNIKRERTYVERNAVTGIGSEVCNVLRWTSLRNCFSANQGKFMKMDMRYAYSTTQNEARDNKKWRR